MSANPTGPLHIGSVRNAVIGDTLANVLAAAGFEIEREYYINDAGSQVRHFGKSIYARYAQALGQDEPFPEDGYQGYYVVEMVQQIAQEYGELKKSIAETCDNDIGQYCDRKDAYVKRIEAVALKQMTRNEPQADDGALRVRSCPRED